MGAVIYFILFTAVAAVIAAWCFYVTATEGDGPRKYKARFLAVFLFGFWFCIAGTASYLYNRSLPVFHFQGTLERIDVLDSSSRHYSAFLHIETTAGGEITVHISDRPSDLLHAGEFVDVTYRGDTGELIKVVYYGADGKQAGVFNSTVTLS